MGKKPKLIIVMGLPATGKTTLSRKIAQPLGLPLINRDEMKVQIMDSVGRGDRVWSKKVGQASYSLLDYVMGQFTISKTSFIIESDFAPEFANEKFNRIHKSGYDIVQVICSTDAEVLIHRWKKRAAEDAAHPSSTEGKPGLDELLLAVSRGPRQPLGVPGEVIRYDSTKLNNFYDTEIINRLRSLLE
ncbi:MAG: AAA family ATPase [Candidatus Saccharimonas sp.]